jgi:DNA-directed RNA polymerase specialized sigma24 family protein
VKELILNEKELINQCIDENRHAQESLFNQYYNELYLIAMRYLSDHHDAEDVIIQSFTKVYKNLNKFSYTMAREVWGNGCGPF